MNIKKTFLNYIAFLIAFAIAFGAGFLVHAQLYPSEFPVLSEAYQLIQEYGYDDLPEDPTMEYGAIRGMVESYGNAYTYFVEPPQAELHNDTLAGSYGGIGSQLERDPDGFIILHPFPESPAIEAGLLDGDRLIQVDDLAITPEMPTDEIVAAVRGPEGARVKLTVQRPPDYTEMEFTVKRAQIPLPSVTWYPDSQDTRLGIIHVNVIAASTPDEIKSAVADLQKSEVTHFVLDLRNNGGGLLVEGVDIARLFLEEGTIIEQQYKGEDIKSYRVKEPGPLTEIPLVVLVNQNTASAAEIISGALQAYGRAPLIGTHTFGKDSVQLVFELQDKSSLHVTSAKWWIPRLEPPVGEGGLQPNITISTENPDEVDRFVEAARIYFFGDPQHSTQP